MSSEVKSEAIQLPRPPLADEWEGKTVERMQWVACSEVLLRFTDGSCCRLTAKGDYDDHACIETASLKPWHLRVLGYMTDEEYDAYQEEQKRAQEAARQEDRRHLYEQLKKKFGEEK